MIPKEAVEVTYEVFFRDAEVRLRQSLTAALGVQVALDATAEALTYGWENWNRVRRMDNPVGYLYKVGRDKGRRMQKRRIVVLIDVPESDLPHIEPGLPRALARLSERQRTVVMLIHSYQWSFSEVADHLGLSKSSVQSHHDRGMALLRGELGGVG